jgi:hypothetical protein
MRWALAAAVALSLSGGQPAPPVGPVAIVVELFTSEGCSSCPPADSLLSKLAAQQPVPGVQIIPLGMHVTYWDRLGWKDPASLALATARQQSYSRVFGEDRVYTPQAIVDGREELVGSDEAGVRKAIAKAAEQPHARLVITPSIDGLSANVVVTIAMLPAAASAEPLQVRMALTESGLASEVKRGENSGRTLRHDGVVRALLDGAIASGQPIAFHTRLRPEWRRDAMAAVALVQGAKTQRIWGAASVALRSPGAGVPETRR